MPEALATSTGYTTLPTATNPADNDRWNETAPRERLLDGTFRAAEFKNL